MTSRPSQHKKFPDIFKRLKQKFSVMIVSALLVVPSTSYALEFWPSEAEWLTWGAMCQARYVVSGSGQSSEFRNRVSADTVNMWKDSLGREAWYGLHHYCAGMVFERRGSLEAAMKEYIYTINRMPSQHHLYIDIAARMANVYYKQGRKEDAYKYATLAIRTGPNSAQGYMIKGLIERKEGQMDAAISTLETGYENTKGTNAELNYHLGLAHFAKGQFSEAKKYAESAYNLGYPLPWLRDQLVSNGHWN